jgi:hypothetical protein
MSKHSFKCKTIDNCWRNVSAACDTQAENAKHKQALRAEFGRKTVGIINTNRDHSIHIERENVYRLGTACT